MRKISMMIFILMILSSATLVSSIEEKEVEKIVKDALSKVEKTDDEVKLLIDLSWFDNSQPLEVSTFAKELLKDYGKAAIFPLGRAVLDSPPNIQKEMIPILLSAYDHRGMTWDTEYANIFSSLLRSPDRDVRVMAMDALAKYRVPRLAIYIIDAVYDDPSLELHGIKTLGIIGDQRGTNFLIEKMASPDETIADAAEEALSKMAWEIPLQLKICCFDDEINIRERCLRLFLPIAKVDDLNYLYQISAKNEKYDPALLEKLKETINKLEEEQDALLQEKEEKFKEEE